MFSKSLNNKAFTLIGTLIILAVLVVLVTLAASLISSQQRISSSEKYLDEARASALSGLEVALGELQAAVGPDQRVTSSADILGHPNNDYGSNVNPIEGRRSWLGYWYSDIVPTDPIDSPVANYSPALPDQRKFGGWLVSASDDNGELVLPQLIEDAATLSLKNEITLFEYDNDPYLVADRVVLNNTKNRDDEIVEQSYFAFAVEDEGVKANLSWSESTSQFTNSDREQLARLSAAPGPDYDIFNETGISPFDVNHPIEEDSEVVADLISNLRDPADLLTLSPEAGNLALVEWSQKHRGNLTWGSKGVLADMKLGGLRRDLSLAFEMDDDAENEDATNFNMVPEFVGGSDHQTALELLPGLPDKQRYLWRETQSSGSPFSADIRRGDSGLRGPSWWVLRDYYNMYKRLKVDSGGNNFVFSPRAYYPNISEGSEPYNYLLRAIVGGYQTWDHEYQTRDNAYVPRPAKANYTPVLVGSVALIGAVPHEGSIAVSVDPIFYLWNPYNRSISFKNYAVASPSYALPGLVKVWVTKPDSDGDGEEEVVTCGATAVREIMGKNAGGNRSTGISYLLRDPDGFDITLEPGEVMVFTVDPVSTSDGIAVSRLAASPGLKESNADISGIIMNQLNVTDSEVPGINNGWQRVPFNATDRVQFAYVKYRFDRNGVSPEDATGGERLITATGLPDDTVSNPGDISPADFGNEVTYSLHNVASSSVGYISPAADSVRNAAVEPVNGMAPTLLSGKTFFGLFATLKKPTNYGTDPFNQDIDDKPIEPFSIMNPLQTAYATDIWAATHPNTLMLAIASQSSNDVFNSYGINFPDGAGDNGHWGSSFRSGAPTHIPMFDIPSSPMLSLASFSNANLGFNGAAPTRMVGFSRANPFVYPESVFDQVNLPNNVPWEVTSQDSAWLANDALFDRYFLSGLAPEYSINSSGYLVNGDLRSTLERFYEVSGDDFRSAKANPILSPYIPEDKTAEEIINLLDPATTTPDLDDPLKLSEEAYKRLAAYSLIDGVFNVNSTSVLAWEAFLAANRDFAINYSSGLNEASEGTPFPNTTSPTEPVVSQPYWSGFTRLTDDQIKLLAEQIVVQVKLRGPFMSLSDFVNHRVGLPVNNETHYSGALQAAIDATGLIAGINGINEEVKSFAGGVIPNYPPSSGQPLPGTSPDVVLRRSTSGIPGEVNQPELLLPLAPRLNARSDTFRIRAYGEVRVDLSGREQFEEVDSRAMCEVVVQRVPEYFDSETNPRDNEPWDQAIDPVTGAEFPEFNDINKKFGRRLKVVQFRWLSPEEIPN